MAQPERIEVNGENGVLEQTIMPGKRKREDGGEEDVSMEGIEELRPETAKHGHWHERDQKALISSFMEVLKSIDTKESLLTRPVPDSSSNDEPQAKRQKSADPAGSSITDKAAGNAYAHLDDLIADLRIVTKLALDEIEDKITKSEDTQAPREAASRVREFRVKALDLFNREKAYPQLPNSHARADEVDANKGGAVLSLIGFAPAEKRLFSSLPIDEDHKIQEHDLPPGVGFAQVQSSTPRVKTQTLGDLFAAPRALPILQAPKPPKTQAKGNTLDWYYPELEDQSKYRANSYFSQRLTAGQFLDYTKASPAATSKSRHRERAQSLAGRKPSSSELEEAEMESLFRGAFSSFAPTKDDSAALVPSNTVGRVWWQRTGQWKFQQAIEDEFYPEEAEKRKAPGLAADIDETAIQSLVDEWDDSIVDPSLEDVMGSKADDKDKEVDEILDEVSGLIETLASYQRIRNLNLPNSQNRQDGNPVNADMLANEGPEPSEEEQATYEVLKAQLTLIIKTLPPYAVAKLNGDQLEDLLISTRLQVEGDQYMGFMEEDEAGMRARAQQQAAQGVRPPSRTPSNASVSYGRPHHSNQYGTPTRTPSQGQPQPYYRQGSYGGAGGYQQPQAVPPTAQQHRPPPHPNQYQYQQQRPPSGVPNQYATQLAKTQTPYGHQNVSHYGGQQTRVQYGQQQQQQQGTPSQRYPQQGYPPQNGPPTPGSNYANYTNGQAAPARTVSPQINRQPYSPSPAMQQQQPQQQGQRYNAPNPAMQAGMNRFSAATPSQSSPPPPSQQQQQQQHQPPPQQSQQGQYGTPTSYHTVIPEASQQRILEQAKARVAAQERTAQFGDRMTGSASPGPATPQGIPQQQQANMDANRLNAARAGLVNVTGSGVGGGGVKPQSPHSANGQALERSASPHVPPRRVTPVPLPNMPGAAPRKGSD